MFFHLKDEPIVIFSFIWADKSSLHGSYSGQAMTINAYLLFMAGRMEENKMKD
jgi:hypothetical protein